MEVMMVAGGGDGGEGRDVVVMAMCRDNDDGGSWG